MRHGRRHLQVLFRGTVPLFFLFRPYLDIEAVGMQSEPCQLVDHHAAVDTTGEQYGDALAFKFTCIHSLNSSCAR